MDKNETISRIVHAEEVLNDYQATLEKIFVEDYGRKYKDLIHERLLNTICITTSTPDINYEFIKKYNKENEIYNMDVVVRDYENYEKIKKDINVKENIALYNLVCHYLEIDSIMYYEKMFQIIGLDFASYCSNTFIREKDNIIVKRIVDLQKKREDYLKECSDLGIKPLTDRKKIDRLLLQMGNIISNFRRELLVKSSYIENLSYSIFSITNTSYSKLDMSFLVEFPAACCVILNKNKNEINNLVYLPLMQIYEEGYNIDNFLLHEFRHAVEASIKGIGLDKISKYHIFNELRTEHHAKEDLDRVEEIFGRSMRFSGYSDYTNLLDLFLESNKRIVDDGAINNDSSMLEAIFTNEKLSEYDRSLTDLYSKVRECKVPGINVNVGVDISNIENLELEMNEIGRSNGSRRYQKILKK